jgi:hypothetical protein
MSYHIVHVKSDKNWDFSTWPSSILITFCTFAGIKKQKISAYHVFREYRHKTVYSGTNLSSFLDFWHTFYHSSVNFCGRTNCLGALKRYFDKNYVSTWSSWKWNYPKNVFSIFFKILKTARRRYFLIRKYWFLNTVTSEILSVFWKYLSQLLFENKVK